MGRTKQSGAAERAKPVQWDKNPEWADKVIEYLTNNPKFRAKLFSDSTQEAKEENRPKVTAKEAKKYLHSELAEYVFKENSDEFWRDEYQKIPIRFATSVGSQFTKWKKQYNECITMLGRTGAGIDPSTIKEGSRIQNLMDKVIENWPLFPKFHAFWREIPSFNPIGTGNSNPGSNHATRARALFDADGGSEAGEDGAEGEQAEEDADLNGLTKDFESLTSPTTATFDEAKIDPKQSISWSNSPSPSPPATPKPKIEKSTQDSAKSSQSSLGCATSSQSLRNFKNTPSKAKVLKSSDPIGRFTEMQANESQHASEKRKYMHIERVRELEEKQKTKKLKLQLKAKLESERLELEKERLAMEKEDREATRKEQVRAAERAHELEMAKLGMCSQHGPSTPAGGSNMPDLDGNAFAMLPGWPHSTNM
ncbi:hypothetical protein FRC12_012757 [Ceratobasidium sp. 428]|nr:hypothetical protein FRC12_012757 [Ceratobasidium sp. 428]